jgi:hypothetical protein
MNGNRGKIRWCSDKSYRKGKGKTEDDQYFANLPIIGSPRVPPITSDLLNSSAGIDSDVVVIVIVFPVSILFRFLNCDALFHERIEGYMPSLLGTGGVGGRKIVGAEN